MNIVSKEEQQLLLNIGFAAAMKGYVKEAFGIFDNLLAVDPTLESARYGRAFLYITCDSFEAGETILKELVAEDGCKVQDEAYAMLALSAALQGNSTLADEYSLKVSGENATAQAMLQAAFAAL